MMTLRFWVRSWAVGLTLAVLFAAAWTVTAWRREDGIPGGVKCQRPIALTALGQSADLQAVSDLFAKAGIPANVNPQLKPGELAEAKSLVLLIGSPSQPGEVERAKALLLAAKDRRSAVVGLYLGSEAARPQCQPFIDLVAPQCGLFIATTAGNRDGFFTRLAGERRLNLLLLDNAAQLAEVLPKLFP